MPFRELNRFLLDNGLEGSVEVETDLWELTTFELAGPLASRAQTSVVFHVELPDSALPVAGPPLDLYESINEQVLTCFEEMQISLINIAFYNEEVAGRYTSHVAYHGVESPSPNVTLESLREQLAGLGTPPAITLPTNVSFHWDDSFGATPEFEATTEADRERWHRAANTTPQEVSFDSGGGMTIDELLGGIDLALDGWSDARGEIVKGNDEG